jgi:hypothetical protein
VVKHRPFSIKVPQKATALRFAGTAKNIFTGDGPPLAK